MKLPRGFVIAVCHGRSRHCGDVLLLRRDDLLVDSVDCELYHVPATSEIVAVRCQRTMILCVYRQPSANDTTLIDSLTRFRLANGQNSVIIVGDFNVHESDWLGSAFTSPAGTALRNFCELFGLSQLVDRGTRKEAILDLAISEHTGTVSYYPHLGTSDHIAVFLSFNTGLQVPSSLPIRKVYHWKSVPWNRLRGYFRRVSWSSLKSGYISDAISTFVAILTTVRDRYLSSTLPTTTRPTVWWD